MRAIVLGVLLVTAAAGSARAQGRQLDIDPATPEGELLQEIVDEEDPAEKLRLLERFAAQYPDHKGAPWALDMLMNVYLAVEQFDKVIATGEKLLALEPDNFEPAHMCLTTSLENLKDPDAVVRWSTTIADMKERAAGTPKPDVEDQAALWERQAEAAKEAGTAAENALLQIVRQTSDPRKKIPAGELLRARFPDSKLRAEMTRELFQAYAETGQVRKALDLADEAMRSNAGDVELLLNAADFCITKEQFEPAADFAAAAVRVLGEEQAPEGAARGEWEAKNLARMGRGNWLKGYASYRLKRWGPADAALRAALPHLEGEDRKAEALLHAGMANFHLAELGEPGRAAAALAFTGQCAAYEGPFQDEARRNLKVIRERFPGAPASPKAP